MKYNLISTKPSSTRLRPAVKQGILIGLILLGIPILAAAGRSTPDFGIPKPPMPRAYWCATVKLSDVVGGFDPAESCEWRGTLEKLQPIREDKHLRSPALGPVEVLVEGEPCSSFKKGMTVQGIIMVTQAFDLLPSAPGYAFKRCHCPDSMAHESDRDYLKSIPYACRPEQFAKPFRSQSDIAK